jgi:hypothetical protein
MTITPEANTPDEPGGGWYKVLLRVARSEADEPQPGLAAAELIDLDGRTWTFIDKCAIFGADIGPATDFPVRGLLRCRLLRLSEDEALIDTTTPDGLDSNGTTQFRIAPSRVRRQDDHHAFGLLDPWLALGDDEALRLVAEATREITSPHELFGFGLRAIARCIGCDDVVFSCSDGTFAIVHLTWATNERSPWPETTRVSSYVGLELVMDQHQH